MAWSITRTPRMRAAWIAYGASTSGSTEPHLDGTKAGSGCAATTNTKRLLRTLARAATLPRGGVEHSATLPGGRSVAATTLVDTSYLLTSSLSMCLPIIRVVSVVVIALAACNVIRAAPAELADGYRGI